MAALVSKLHLRRIKQKGSNFEEVDMKREAAPISKWIFLESCKMVKWLQGIELIEPLALSQPIFSFFTFASNTKLCGRSRGTAEDNENGREAVNIS